MMLDDVGMNIRNDMQEPPHRNPLIACADCGERYGYEEYWKERFVDPDDVNHHEATWRCDGCKTITQNREQNQSLFNYQ